MAPGRVGLAVITFGAEGNTVVYDAISSQDDASKCDFFLEPPGNTSWDQVQYDYDTPEGKVRKIEAARQWTRKYLVASFGRLMGSWP